MNVKYIIVCIMFIMMGTSVHGIDITNPYPSNGTIDICPPVTELGITVSDAYGKTMNITFWTNLSTGAWDYFYTGQSYTIVNVSNGTYFLNPVLHFSLYNYTYYWNVSVNNGSTTISSDTYYFITASINCASSASSNTIYYAAASIGIVGLLGLFGFLFRKKKREKRKRRKKKGGNLYE